jgi:hypothetical protein
MCVFVWALVLFGLHVNTHGIVVVVVVVVVVTACFLPGTSLELAVTPTAQASSFTLQYFPYYV